MQKLILKTDGKYRKIFAFAGLISAITQFT
jgi:hypothetical protein